MLNSRPKPDEVEVSLFGPGYGESVVVHLGNDDWMIVDSFRPAGQPPIALAYLQCIGVAADRVKLIVASHWHDDHIKGMSDLLEACPNATFCCSSAFRERELLAFVELHDTPMSTLGSGVDELRRILHRLDGRKYKWAGEGTQLWRRRPSPKAVVWSISPTSNAFRLATAAIANLAVEQGQTKTRLTPSQLPNDLCVVLWVSVGDCNVLLGADMEEPGGLDRGWSAVVRQDPVWDSYADVFKVPHHGSKTGHCDAVWQDLLKSQPFALVTPYTRQARPLPTPADRIRIRAATENAYTTATEIETTVIERSRGVQRFLSKAGRQPVVRSARGQIRLRASASVGAWSVETHPPAGRL